MLFTLTEERGLSPSQFATVQSSENLLIAIASLVYFFLCQWFQLRRLLYAGLIVGVFGCIGIIFARNYATAVLAAAWFGASCGLGNVAVNDLMIRAAPSQREGLSLMLTMASIILFIDISDLVGSFLYEHGGFGLAMGVTSAIPALLIGAVILLPGSLVDRKEARIILSNSHTQSD